MNSKFPKVDREIWKIPSEIDWGCTSFEELVEKLAETFDIYSVKRNRCNKDSKYYRLLIKIKAQAKLVSAFHSSEFGYRAQYYLGTKFGEEANRYLIDYLTSRLIEKIKQMEKSTCKPVWVAKSLSSPDAKIWIHQGPWLRKREQKIRKLQVERWILHINDRDKNIANKALWSTLVPNEEKLDIKGGFILLDGSQSEPNPKSNRSKQIHEYGFT